MRSVLVVEDDPDLRDLERTALEFYGFSVTLAANGADALTKLERDPPDVILLDLMMPVMDGLTFLAERQKRHMAQTVPVVCLSAGGHEMLAHALRLGASECIHKPPDIDDLCRRVARYCDV